MASPAQGPTQHSLHRPGLQVHHHTPGHVSLPPHGLSEEHIGPLQLPSLVITNILSTRTYPMLQSRSQSLCLDFITFEFNLRKFTWCLLKATMNGNGCDLFLESHSLPELCPNLVSALAYLYVDQLSHNINLK